MVGSFEKMVGNFEIWWGVLKNGGKF